jgi:hypothetical protein
MAQPLNDELGFWGSWFGVGASDRKLPPVASKDQSSIAERTIGCVERRDWRDLEADRRS